MTYLQQIQLKNFRCYRQAQFSFFPNLNILVGDNAVGKTSVAEAVHFLGLAKSHKAGSDSEMIRIGENFASVVGYFMDDDRNEEIRVSITADGKRILRNNKKVSQISEYVGNINVVIFCPEDLELIKGGPSVRRKFLDVNISQMNTGYLKSSIRYKRLLRERNEILKIISNSQKYDYTLLKIVTQELAREAKIIIEERRRFIERINPRYRDKTAGISSNAETGEIKYIPSVSEEMAEIAFEEKIRVDIAAGTTTVGPHRDDFLISINGETAVSFGSQGQQRTLALAIKLALADLICEENRKLIVILDDVFSELDIFRQNEILKLLDQGNQILITTTTIENLSPDIINKSNIIEIYKEEEDER